MKILQKHHEELIAYLSAQLSEGKEWLVFDQRRAGARPSVIDCFTTIKAAREYKEEHERYFTNIAIVPIHPIVELIQHAFYYQRSGELMPDHITINVEAVLKNSLQSQQLYEQNYLTQQLFHQEKSKTMNEKNLDYLSKQLHYTGFGESLQDKLKEQLQKGEKEFGLPYIPDFAKETTAVMLQFKKSETQDNYFFNRYSVHIKTPDYPDAIKQTFYLNQGQDNITLKEAFNLLHGRAVHKELTPKEGEKYMAWVQLDFKNTEPSGNYKIKQFHQNYGFDLDATLLQRPIKELQVPEHRERLIASLERGNRQLVTFAENGKKVKAFIEAAPQFKSLNYYNEQHKRVDLQTINKSLAPESVQKEKQPQQSVAPDEEDGSTKKKRSKKLSI